MSPSTDNLARLWEIFENHCAGYTLWAYTAKGQLVWPIKSDPATPVNLNIVAWRRDVAGLCWDLDDRNELLAWPVSDQEENLTHYLVVRSEKAGTSREEICAQTAAALAMIAESLQTSMQLNRVLDEMSRELAARYEELNLVYYTEDEVRYLDEGRQALSALVVNCNEYLSLDATALLIPDLGISLTQHSPEAAFDLATLDLPLQRNIIKAVESNLRTVVCNDPEQTRSLLGFPCRMIACPVQDSSGNNAGTLVVAKDKDAPEFVNSDRNLLIVMAGKASKIIQSTYDSLTGLMRQDGFDRCLSSALTHAKSSEQSYALLHVNVDRMHLINDTIGYHAGDYVLQTIAAELRCNLRESDRIARLGGDEFGILIRGCTTGQGEAIAEKLRHAVSALKIECGDQIVEVTACIGVTALDKETGSTISAHAGAEIACSVAKEMGRNRAHAYHKDDSALVERQQQMEWVGRLKNAIQNDRFQLYCQKIVPLQEDIEGYHFEILVRMLGDHGEILPPAGFLQVAERYQMMPALDRWIVEHTLKTLAPHTAALLDHCIKVSINLSGQTLIDEGFATFVTEQLKHHGISPSLIRFEITETAAIANLDDARRFMHELKGLGCSFSLDDFGAGLSSFAYLRTLPVDSLKIDGSFVTPIVDDETAAAMLAAMNQIGQLIGLSTVAEFAESEAIITRLREIGLDYAQGHGVSRPRPIAEELKELEALGQFHNADRVKSTA